MDERMWNHRADVARLAEGLRFRKVDHFSPFKMESHVHAEPECIFLLSGTVVCQQSHKKDLIGSMSFSYMPGGQDHATEYLEPVSALYIALQPNIIDSLDIQGQARTFWNGPMIDKAKTILNEYDNWDASSPLMTQGLMLQMLASMARLKPTPEATLKPKWLLDARDLIREEMHDSLTIQEIASRVGIHPVHLMRTFKTAFGCSIGEYARKLRIEAAANCLKRPSNESSIAEIALDLGFRDHSQFCRAFRTAYGMSPTEYRKLFQA